MHAPLRQDYRVEWQPLVALSSIADEWRALASRAAEPNVFYDPAFALAAAPVFGADAGALVVRSAAGRLAGLLPARTGRPRGGVVPMLMGWTHAYAPLGVPLLDRDDPEAVLAACFDHVANDPAMPSYLLLDCLPEQGRFAEILDAVLGGRGLRHAPFGRHQRALLDPGVLREGYLDRALSSGRRKELRRQRRRLEDFAPVTFSTTTSPGEIAAALKDFFVLEASGWKGMAGTAIVSDPGVKTFVAAAVQSLATEGRARIDRMLLNGRAIAAAVTLTSGDTAWCWKIAYNEGVAQASPGVQLVCEVTERLLTDASPARVDSCAVADHPMIDRIWRERLPVGDRLIALKPSVLPFGAACALETLRRSAIAAAKSARDRLRGEGSQAPRKSGFGAQQPADNLAGGGHRHLVDEGDLARVLMRRQAGSNK